MRPLGRTGLVVSELGFGGSPLGGVFGAIDEAQGVTAVHDALAAGINFFDVAPFYGATRAETVLGHALRDVPRDRFVLSTKVGRYGERDFDFSAARVRASVAESMARLGVDHLDLVLCHDIELTSAEQIIDETLPALRELRASGRVRAIGVSALPVSILQDIVNRTEVDVVLAYCHYNLFDATVTHLALGGTGLIAAAPLAMGLLTDAGPPPWHPAPRVLVDACARVAEHCRTRGIDLARTALRHALSCQASATTLVGMRSPAEVAANIGALADDGTHIPTLRALLAPVADVTWPSGRG